MITAIKSIWPDKEVKVLKVKDNSLGSVTLTNYGTSVIEGGYEYQIVVSIAPEDTPAETIELMDMEPPDAKQFEIESIKSSAWIIPPRDFILTNDQGGRRKNIHIVQRVDFKCVDSNTYVTTSILKDKGSTVADPTSQDPESAYTRQWSQKLTPVSKKYAETAASAVCNTGCNSSEIYKFYKSYLDIDKPGFEFGDNFRKGSHRAFDEYPKDCP
ncbi:MAG: hypothetical protein CL946_13855 [Ectothiorhodospiraceae bacterium]|nr:hypothetical protein [Ectothiorhodospiraceae bacterium]